MDAGMVVGVVLAGVVVMQAVMIWTLKQELKKCRSRERWGMQVRAGKKDLAVIR